jgi:hypothetical protein
MSSSFQGVSPSFPERAVWDLLHFSCDFHCLNRHEHMVTLWVRILRFPTKVSLRTPAIVTTCLVVFHSSSKQIPDYYFKLNLDRFRHHNLELCVTDCTIIRRHSVWNTDSVLQEGVNKDNGRPWKNNINSYLRRIQQKLSSLLVGRHVVLLQVAYSVTFVPFCLEFGKVQFSTRQVPVAAGSKA